MSEIRIGCSGWNYHHWREIFYPRGLPESRWLEHYARSFDTVEVNATFYRLPSRASTERWAEATTTGFVFTVKASRYLTHVKRLRTVADGAARLLERIEPLVRAGKLGPILWQLPENFHRDDDRLAEALTQLPPGRHACEFRHESWFVPEVEALLREHGVALVVGDTPERPFQTLARTAAWMYARLHHGRGRDANYTPTQLREWAERVREWREEGDVYIYFNDDWRGHAVREALRLKELSVSVRAWLRAAHVARGSRRGDGGSGREPRARRSCGGSPPTGARLALGGRHTEPLDELGAEVGVEATPRRSTSSIRTTHARGRTGSPSGSVASTASSTSSAAGAAGGRSRRRRSRTGLPPRPPRPHARST